MGIFTRFGDLIIKLFSLVGMLILAIPKIPQKLRGIDTDKIRQKVDSEKVKGNLSKIKEEVGNVKETYSGQKQNIQRAPSEFKKDNGKRDVLVVSGEFTSEDKERTVLHLQLASAAFIVFSILHVFNFLSFLLFILLGGLTVAFVLYVLFTRIKLMYPQDFNAYRDFFLMYLAVGVIISLVSGNSSLVMAFSFQALPSLSILIYAIIAVVIVFLIFRMRYYRNFTYGTVVEAGKNTAHVKVEYDIRSNVKPDLYLVENNVQATEGDTVKLKIEEKVLSTGGNKPLGIIEVISKV